MPLLLEAVLSFHEKNTKCFEKDIQGTGGLGAQPSILTPMLSRDT